ncbi:MULTISPECIES: bifunctional glycosyltransferase/class I SAM-dependent methyltransferase [unclassified Treponema]|uniref:bifunctional glycosyltransferase/class I SAM-dependent methyltransferase n=1 Tax=unclassified Treponema TaxID=2638727 RepID=UPI0020A418A4|nr:MULTISPECIES: methyltransferase domain-containing protein [unclassified Treponema]UTC68282.1 methyltransferase domain-containing protein [Treponema sp. OMZ 789]UTC71003.1 methyltransferase domain-containing protein [Treponema sp. OMZ 790]UTC73744.1 methyltransferase domain-containing protein [Treponema sp. OMZ 791]
MIGLYEGTAVIVQARLNSKRLVRKALLNLGDNPILYRVLDSVRALPAEHFILACDTSSKKEFQPIADAAGYLCIDGSEEDVLKRFCDAVEFINSNFPNKPVKAIVRVTADNPFLFVQAAEASMRRYFELGEPDYFTYTGLPHGSGIEIIKAASLLKAASETDDSYAHEHVAPAIYSHPDKYRCIRETAPPAWYYPELRTTVDTAEDYEKAKEVYKYLVSHKKTPPFVPSDIVEAVSYADRTVVFCPSVTPGRGSGHLHRVCDLVGALLGKLRCLIYIPQSDYPNFSKSLLNSIPSDIIINEFPQKAALIVLDRFRTSEDEMTFFKHRGPVVVIDEGGPGRKLADFILDILPSLRTGNSNEESLMPENSPNIFSPEFISLPVNRKKNFNKLYKNKRIHLTPEKTKVLVVCGGENSYRMTLPIAQILASLKFDVSAIDINLSFEDIKRCEGKIKAFSRIENLKERLYEWDLVVTHYGFTAFEALAAGCYVLLVSPTDYHYKLGLASGFTALPAGIPSVINFADAFSHGIKIPKIISPDSKTGHLPSLIKSLSFGTKHLCPICGEDGTSEITARTPDRTMAHCLRCGMYHISFIVAPPKQYTKTYFFDEYKAQYGKTYLEDFESIRKQGMRRMEIIDKLYIDIFYRKREYSIFDGEKKILDIGCAYGPFVLAAKYSGWYAVGTDISESAVQYVTDTLKLPAFVSAFPALPQCYEYIYQKQMTGSGFESVSVHIENSSFAALSMWFVIEHFRDLDSVLKRVNGLLMPGGIFAFSTPNFSGVTGTFSPYKFFAQSPTDHYSIWDAKTVKDQLSRYGFKVLKIVSIGHHPERFKWCGKLKKNGILWNIVLAISKLFKLGDSMEVYAMKQGTLEDVK